MAAGREGRHAPALGARELRLGWLSRWERPVRVDGAVEAPEHLTDFLGYLAVYVGGITLLPWLLGYGSTRLLRFVRTRRHDPGGPDHARDADPSPPGPPTDAPDAPSAPSTT
ncbi:hypothetical protein ABZY57_18580 [Streptomyces sp. NPDC006450]|uniref:hypothetical protein n=1 Tax=Streptomyces sp. NPDC006450 TaxID=3155458 RepID=UPI0033ACBE6E